MAGKKILWIRDENKKIPGFHDIFHDIMIHAVCGRYDCLPELRERRPFGFMGGYLDLFLTFAKIGAVTFGGGYAMLPILERELVDKRGWVADEELADYFAIGQCTPGIIAVNVSTFIGNKRKGVLGGIIATTGFASAPFALLSLVAAGLGYLLALPVVRSAFAGIRVCVCVLILNAVLRLWKRSVKDITTFAIFLTVLLLSAFGPLLPVRVSPAFYVAGSALAGVLACRGKGGAGK